MTVIDKSSAILHMIGQYNDITDGGGVRPIMLALWLNLSRQAASWHLRNLHKEHHLKREPYQYRPDVTAYRYYLTEDSREKYEAGMFKKEYLEFVSMEHSAYIFNKFIESGER